MPKKERRGDCFNYKCISVTSIMSYLYRKVLQIILEEEYGHEEIEEQAGFRASRSCTVFILTQLNEKKVGRN